jgi:hypothetical protein
MRTHLLIAAALALAATVSSANALTVVNADKTSHAVMVTPQGGKAKKFVIKGSHSANYKCAKGCDLQLGADKAHYDSKIQKIWIRAGRFASA